MLDYARRRKGDNGAYAGCAACTDASALIHDKSADHDA